MRWFFLLLGLLAFVATAGVVAQMTRDGGEGATVFHELEVILLFMTGLLGLGLYSVLGALQPRK